LKSGVILEIGVISHYDLKQAAKLLCDIKNKIKETLYGTTVFINGVLGHTWLYLQIWREMRLR